MKVHSGLSRRVRAVAAMSASAALLVAAFGSTATSASAAPVTPPAQTINIATISDLSGPLAVIGLAGNQGQRVAVAVINSNPKKYLCSKDRKIELSYYDSTNSVATALTLNRNIVADGKSVALIGPLYTAQAEAMAPFNQASKLTMLSPYTQGSTDQTGAGDFVFAQAQGDIATAQTATAAIAKAWPNDKIIGILYAGDSANIAQSAPILEKNLQAIGKTVVKFSVPFRSLDMNSAIASFKAQGVQAVYSYVNSPAQVALLQAATRADYQPHWFGYSTMFDQSIIDNGGRQVEGILLTADYNPSINSPLVNQFKTVYQNTAGKAANSWAALGYQSVMNMAAAMCRIKVAVTRANLQPALARVVAPSILNGGIFRFTPTRLNAIPSAVLKIQGGKFVTWRP